MTHGGEFWLVYQFASRGNAAPTSQLIELAVAGQKLYDLEDVLEYAAMYYGVNDVRLHADIQVFRQGYVEARFRPVTTWARRDGVPVHPSDSVEELLKQGVGKCAETAIVLAVDDAPTNLWFTYYYVHSPEAKVSTQRVRLNQGIKFEHIAHLTNYVFNQGYLPGPYRPLVHWETQCGKKLAEDALVVGALGNGFGATDGKAIRLVVG
ncbi:hypothetical protein AN958_04536 [Leucoagaricus sp. SymC.cos]|nr:hypothetical protein AN958_04536 [Leucoagaricus sp. SymC.cos]